AQRMTISAESAAVHHENIVKQPESFGGPVRKGFDFGHMISAVDYLQAQQVRLKMKEEFAAMFKQVDVLISPTHPFTATKIGKETILHNGKEISAYDNVSRFSRPGNLVGLPTISLPCGLHEGLSVDIQILG